jgi:hypothetical protein
MTDIQLNAGELWDLAGERHYLEQVMGGGFLLFRSERTSSPFQIELDSGEKVSADHGLAQGRIAGRHRPAAGPPVREEPHRTPDYGSKDDYDAIIRRDPYAAVRHIVLNALDLLPGRSLRA